ncbi:B1 protein-like [Diabrotica undecimpunctata]|uniref:B1 protein-like n=1 Tax=Diabrotica undecimpunctata TaxID=50387 RepID=UPI003B63C242
MKFLVLSLVFSVCFVYADITSEQFEKLKSHHKECLPKSGVNPELVQKARQGNFVNDQKLKEHIFCVSKLIGFQNEAGDIQTDVLQAKVGAALGDPALAAQLIATCAKKQASGPETAYETIKCYKEKSPNHISIV